MDKLARVHIFGASGSGSTTLGRALAISLGIMHIDVDDHYWKQTDPPFREKNVPSDRVRSIKETIGSEEQWVLTGSLVSWGERLVSECTLGVFLHLDSSERMSRLRQREHQRHGDRIAPNGDMYESHLEFMQWAQAYDVATSGIRCRQVHVDWMAGLSFPVVVLRSDKPPEELLVDVVHADAQQKVYGPLPQVETKIFS